MAFMHSKGGIYGNNAATKAQRNSFTVHTLGSGGYASGFKKFKDVTHHVNTDSNGFEDVVPRIAGGIDFGNDATVKRYATSEGILGCHSFESYARTAIMDIGKGYFNENRP